MKRKTISSISANLILKRLRLYAPLFLIVVLSSSLLSLPSVFATESTAAEKGLLFLSDVLELNLTKYSVTNKTSNEDLYFGVVPEDGVFFTLTSNQSNIRMHFTFAEGAVHIVNVMDNTGTPQTVKPVGTPLEMAEGFLSNYQAFTGEPFYGDLKSTLEGVDVNVNSTKTSGNLKLTITVKPPSTDIRWIYTCNGVDSAYKCVVLNYQNGFLKYFIDTWRLWPIASTAIMTSEEEAISIAMNAAKNFASQKGYNISGVAMARLYFLPSLYADNPRNENLLALYPAWRIGIALDKWYGGVYGIYVDVWADTKEIRHIEEAFSMMSPDDFPQPSPSPNLSPQSSPTTSPSPTLEPEPTSLPDSPTAPPESATPPESTPSSNSDLAQSPSKQFTNTLPLTDIAVAGTAAIAIIVTAATAVFLKKRRK